MNFRNQKRGHSQSASLLAHERSAAPRHCVQKAEHTGSAFFYMMSDIFILLFFFKKLLSRDKSHTKRTGHYNQIQS